jgi:hypothetical protein
MTASKAEPVLREPMADELREACTQAAARLSTAFGAQVAMSVPDWHLMRGEWRMSWSWLLKCQVPLGQLNAGFRVTLTGRRCTVGVWGPCSGELSCEGPMSAEMLSGFLDLALTLPVGGLAQALEGQ